MKVEADRLGVFRRDEGHGRRGRQVVRGRVDLGVNDVAGDSERGPLRPLGGERSGGRQGAGQQQHILLHSHRSPYRSHPHSYRLIVTKQKQ